jgi:hypothetical protein
LQRRNDRFVWNIQPFAVSKRIVTRIFVRGIVLRSLLSKLIVVASFLCLLSMTTAGQKLSSTETANLFPKTIGDFRSQGANRSASLWEDSKPEGFNIQGAAEGTFVSPRGEKMSVLLVKTRTQDSAYALLTTASAWMKKEKQAQPMKQGDIGTAGYIGSDRVAFYKGRAYVVITKLSGKDEKALEDFARAFAGTLEQGENEIPVLVKHLPDWEKAQERAIYAVTPQELKRATDFEPVFDAVSFEGGAEAVTATYDNARLVIVEFTTPQIAASNDASITERIKQLRENGQPVPSLYRRVGNYSVFVFNASDETAAAKLVDQVKYEQSIQWLGENPLAWARAEKQHTREAVSLILGIAKTIGFFVAICLGGGAVVGGLAFLRRRSQQRAAAETYSDAGGMLRLNIDEMTPETDPGRLLGSGE